MKRHVIVLIKHLCNMYHAYIFDQIDIKHFIDTVFQYPLFRKMAVYEWSRLHYNQDLKHFEVVKRIGH